MNLGYFKEVLFQRSCQDIKNELIIMGEKGGGQGRERWGSSGRHRRVEGAREVQSWPPAGRLVLESGQVLSPGSVYLTCAFCLHL